jgi:N,N'-diacetyllegionaminate synthase
MEKNYMNKKCEIIAEIANAHQGKPELAKKLAIAAIKSGADAIKFQVYFAEELLTSSHSRFDHFKKQSFEEKTWTNIIRFFKKKNIKVYCDIFGEKAFKIAKKCNVDGYKIHSSDLNNDILLKLLKNTSKKIFISAGGSTIEEIAFAINFLVKRKHRPIILHGFQNYPTSAKNCELLKIKSYKNIFGNNCELGYQDHISSEDLLNYSTPLIAIGLGAKYIEKHITFNRKKKGTDYYSSLEPNEFKNFVNLVRKSELAIGEEFYENMSLPELNYRSDVKKVWFLKKSIKKGSLIKKNNLIMLRPGLKNLNNTNLNFIKNKKSLTDINNLTALNNSMVVNNVTAIIVARSNSKRLKKKAYKKICNLTTIEHLIKRVKKAKKINKIILCTTKKKEDDQLKKIAQKNKILCFRGPDKDVLQRMLGAIKNTQSDTIVRITGDDILIDPEYLDKTINYHFVNNLQYTDAKKLPSGIDAEIFDRNLLELIYKLSEDTSNTEYLTYYISNHKSQFKTGSLNVKNSYRNQIRLTLDNKKDLQVISKFLQEMKKNNKLIDYNYNDLINFYKKNKQLFKKNKIYKKKSFLINTSFNWKKIILN